MIYQNNCSPFTLSLSLVRDENFQLIKNLSMCVFGVSNISTNIDLTVCCFAGATHRVCGKIIIIDDATPFHWSEMVKL